MSPTEPNPHTLTLRLKHHKTTILILADPLKPFLDIKTELLRGLLQRYPDGSLSASSTSSSSSGSLSLSSPTSHASHSLAIPSDPSRVQLAKPTDPHDPAKGWTRLYTSDEPTPFANAPNTQSAANGGTAVDPLSKKRKAHPDSDAQTAQIPGTEIVDTPKGAGLRDGGVLAFRFSGAGVANGVTGGKGGVKMEDDVNMEQGDEDGGVGMDVDDAEDGEGWDVVLPSYEDAAGVGEGG